MGIITNDRRFARIIAGFRGFSQINADFRRLTRISLGLFHVPTFRRLPRGQRSSTQSTYLDIDMPTQSSQALIQKDVEGGAMSDELPSIGGFAYLPGGAPAARPYFRGPPSPPVYPRLSLRRQKEEKHDFDECGVSPLRPRHRHRHDAQNKGPSGI